MLAYCFAKGKIRKKYLTADYRIPVDRLLDIPDVEIYLKDGVTATLLLKQKLEQSHFKATEAMGTAKETLFGIMRKKD